jgi:hypothetical protein
MRLDRDAIAYLNFHLPRQYPELFETLHHAVQEHLDGLKAAGTLPDDIEVRPAQEIAERKRYAAVYHRQLRQLLKTESPKTSIEF